jgi:hypothetical protein
MELKNGSDLETSREARLAHRAERFARCVFAFPKQRKEPLTDASHVRNAIARFDQTIDVSDYDRELAFANIKKAAQHYGVDMTETDWTQLGRTPHTGRTEEDRKKSAREAAATRKREG